MPWRIVPRNGPGASLMGEIAHVPRPSRGRSRRREGTDMSPIVFPGGLLLGEALLRLSAAFAGVG